MEHEVRIVTIEFSDGSRIVMDLVEGTTEFGGPDTSAAFRLSSETLSEVETGIGQVLFRAGLAA
jgi:hypothetical protein